MGGDKTAALELLLDRARLDASCTIGNLFVNGVWQCFTLEDPVRAIGVKVYGDTAIPAGRYRVIVNESKRFKRRLPLLLNVPNFDGIRIHPGNRSKDTEGCILVGTRVGADAKSVDNSRDAFAPLLSRIVHAITLSREVWITITNK